MKHTILVAVSLLAAVATAALDRKDGIRNAEEISKASIFTTVTVDWLYPSTTTLEIAPETTPIQNSAITASESSSQTESADSYAASSSSSSTVYSATPDVSIASFPVQSQTHAGSYRTRTRQCFKLTTQLGTAATVHPWTSVRPVTSTLVSSVATTVTTTFTTLLRRPYSTSIGTITQIGEKTIIETVRATFWVPDCGPSGCDPTGRPRARGLDQC